MNLNAKKLIRSLCVISAVSGTFAYFPENGFAHGGGGGGGGGGHMGGNSGGHSFSRSFNQSASRAPVVQHSSLMPVSTHNSTLSTNAVNGLHTGNQSTTNTPIQHYELTGNSIQSKLPQLQSNASTLTSQGLKNVVPQASQPQTPSSLTSQSINSKVPQLVGQTNPSQSSSNLISQGINSKVPQLVGQTNPSQSSSTGSGSNSNNTGTGSNGSSTSSPSSPSSSSSSGFYPYLGGFSGLGIGSGFGGSSYGYSDTGSTGGYSGVGDYVSDTNSNVVSTVAAPTPDAPSVTPAVFQQTENPLVLKLGTSYTFDNDSLGATAGQMSLELNGITLPVQVDNWDTKQISFTLPNVGIVKSVEGKLQISNSDHQVQRAVVTTVIAADEPKS